MLNNGLGFSDEFEVETFKFSEKSNSKLKQQYKEWTTAMKSEGKEFFKSVKDKVYTKYFDQLLCKILSNH